MFKQFALLATVLTLTALNVPVAAARPPREVRLPGKVGDIIVAGRGRVLLLQMDKLMKLAVFDLKAEKITGYISMGSGETLVAATSDEVILVAPDKKVIQRWTLDPPTKRLTVMATFDKPMVGVAAGWDGPGPALVLTEGGPQFIETKTLTSKPDGPSRYAMRSWSYDVGYATGLDASADGSVFTMWQPTISPSGIRRLELSSGHAATAYEHVSAGRLHPSSDGAYIFTGAGIYDAELKKVDPDRFENVCCLPTLHPAYFVGVAMPDFKTANEAPAKEPTVNLYATSERTLLTDLPQLGDLDLRPTDRMDARSSRSWGTNLQGLSNRLFVSPQLKKIALLSGSRDKLRLVDFDVIDALNAKGIDYLFVESTALTTATAGQTYAYPIKAVSKAGGVKVTLDTGPDGMTVTPAGVLTWKVPEGFAGERAGVIATVEDASGQTRFHSFTISVHPTTEPAVAPDAGK